MRSIDRRLHALARVYGCPTHGESRICADCDASAPMPAWLKEGVDAFMDGILARVSPEEIRLVCYRVPAPMTEPCRQCGGVRTCLSCTQRYAKALFRAIGLTVSEEKALRDMTARVRAIDVRE